jgi:hypothetical protein
MQADGLDCFASLARRWPPMRLSTAIANVFTRGPPRWPYQPPPWPIWRRAIILGVGAGRGSWSRTAAASRCRHARAQMVQVAAVLAGTRGVPGQGALVDGFAS